MSGRSTRLQKGLDEAKLALLTEQLGPDARDHLLGLMRRHAALARADIAAAAGCGDDERVGALTHAIRGAIAMVADAELLEVLLMLEIAPSEVPDPALITAALTGLRVLQDDCGYRLERAGLRPD